MKKNSYQKKEAYIPVKINVKNTPYLVIVESPSKCKKIEKYLGFQYKCIASKGHICEISRLSKNYEPNYEIIADKKKHVETMKEIISHFQPENIYLATDDDREGEAIAWHICRIFKLSIENTHRILFHEITDSVIRAAVAFPIKIRMNIVNAQKARQVLDRLVGFEISPLLTKRIGQNTDFQYLSAGRCQTPALRLVYDLEQNKTEKEWKYQTTGIFFSLNLSCKLSHYFKTPEECIHFLEQSRTFSHIYSLENPENKKTHPGLPFNTSSLLQYMNNHLHISPKETMNCCQILYQNGYITYMRTESTKYSLDFLNKIKECFDEPRWIGDFKKIQNNNENNPHEAIRITKLEKCSLERKDIDENIETVLFSKIVKIYDIIRNRTIESCMSDYEYRSIQIKIDAPQGYYYHYYIEIPIFLGWKKVYMNEIECKEIQEKQNAFYFSLQHAAKNKMDYKEIDIKIICDKQKEYYTESGLIKKLEDLGIGRPSTFAMIIETIQDRKYVIKQNIEGEKKKVIEFHLKDDKLEKIEKEKKFGEEKNKLVLQDLGKKVIEELITTFNIVFSYDYTQKMEIDLDLVSNEEKEWMTVCKQCENEIIICSNKWKKETQQKYKIDEKHELIFGKKGPVIRSLEKKDQYLAVRNIEIDIEKLKKREYALEELLEIPNEILGIYENETLYLKTGKYGAYVTWGNNTEKIEKMNKKLWEITLNDIKDYLSNKKTVLAPNVLRNLTELISIRKGKYGNYIYYKQKEKPEFYNLKLCPIDYLRCEKEELMKWLNETYGISVFTKYS